MGVDLTLLIPPYENLGDFMTCGSELEIARNGTIFDSISDLQSFPVLPYKFHCYHGDPDTDGERRYGQLTEDPYGDAPRYVKAGALANRLGRMIHDDPETHRLTRAAAKYLAELSEEWPVVLYWH